MSNEDKLTLLDTLNRMEALAKDLKQLGVPADAIPDIMGRIEEYAELKEGLDAARAEQFHWDAYEVLQSAQSASNKATKALTAYLRKFARHVAEHTLSLAGEYEGDMDALVDHIPQMSDSQEQGDEEEA